MASEPSCTLVRNCLAAIKLGCPKVHEAIWACISQDPYNLPEASQKSVLEKLQSSSVFQGKMSKEWELFSGLVLELPTVFSKASSSEGSISGAKIPVQALVSTSARSSWEKLLCSSRHQETLNKCLYSALDPPLMRGKEELLVARNGWAPLLWEKAMQNGYLEITDAMQLEVLESLHAVYEEMKLDVLKWRDLPILAHLVLCFSSSIGELNYTDFYLRDFPHMVHMIENSPKYQPAKTIPSKPPSITAHVLQILTKSSQVATNMEGDPETTGKQGPIVASPLRRQLAFEGPDADICVEWSQKIILFFKALAKGQKGALKCVELMVEKRFGLPEIERLPPAVALQLHTALYLARMHPPSHWPTAAYVLIGRQDLAAQKIQPVPKRTNHRAGSAFLIKKAFQNPQAHQSEPLIPEIPRVPGIPDVEDASCTPMTSRQVAHSFSAASPHSLSLRSVPLPSEISENDGPIRELGVAELATQLGAGPARSTARKGSDDDVDQWEDGMSHVEGGGEGSRFPRDLRMNEVRHLLSSASPVAVRFGGSSESNDPDFVLQQQTKLIQLAQRTTALPAGRAAFTVATQTAPLTEPLDIPKIVLAGKLPSQQNAMVSLDISGGGLSELTTWPDFHNGVAAGLQIAPGQPGMSATWIGYNRPEEPSNAHAGVLLALGLQRHLAVLPSTHLYFYLSQEHTATTVSVLLGMSAAKRGSMDSTISKMLYLHIPTKHPPNFPELELSTIVQSAALVSVGLLYQKTAHRLTTEILLAEINRKPAVSSALDRECYSLSAGFALGLVTLGKGSEALGLSDLRLEDRLERLFGSTSESEEKSEAEMRLMADSHQQNSSQVLEGATVNLDITAPGAIMALCLMYLKSNSPQVASRLNIPKTYFELEHVRPDLLFLRVIARNLVMWDSVDASEAWIQGQVPAVMRLEKQGHPIGSGKRQHGVDRDSAAQSHASVLAGACVAMGLRYAGTADVSAQQVLHKMSLFFLHEKRLALLSTKLGGVSGKGTFGGLVDPATLETFVDSTVLALSMVMAGSGDLNTFRLIRFLRKRPVGEGSAIGYGNHMAVGMSLGFLFLGGGLQTFGRSVEAVAALLMATFPVFPFNANDNRCHLQALRHLWVLAVEDRSIRAVDVDTGLPLHVSLDVTFQETAQPQSLSLVAPCSLPEAQFVKRIRIHGSNLWTQTLDLSRQEAGPVPLLKRRVILVKRKLSSKNVRTPPHSSHGNATLDAICEPWKPLVAPMDGEAVDFENPFLQSFSRLFCQANQGSTAGGIFGKALEPPFTEGALLRFCSQTLQLCTNGDNEAMIPIYLSLSSTVETLVDIVQKKGGTGRGISLSHLLWNIKAIKSVYESRPEIEKLLQPLWISMLDATVDQILSSAGGGEVSGSDYQLLSEYVKCCGMSPFDPIVMWKKLSSEPRRALQLTCILERLDIPEPSTLREILCSLAETSNVMRGLPVMPVLSLLAPSLNDSTVRALSQIVEAFNL